MEKISVIIPAYNAEKYLEQCVESVRTQIYNNIEIIIVNDGSTDRTAEIIERLKEKDSRMGVHSDIMRDTARIVGGESFQGAEVMSTDLRASATLVLMGLVAEGETKVSKLSHLDRGYYQFHEKLVALGADVKRVEEEDDEN